MIRRLAARWAILAIAFAVVAGLMSGVHINGGVRGVLWVSALFGVVNMFIGSLVRLITIPLMLLTLGLFGIVVNAALLLLIAWIASIAKFDFTVGGFPPTIDLDTIVAAVIGAVAIGLVGSVVGMVVRD